jgi:hypothetical protein
MRAGPEIFVIQGARPPVIEVDFACGAVYVRFGRGAVARTVARANARMHVAVDLDSQDKLIGIEAVGAKDISLRRVEEILQAAGVRHPNVDMRGARFEPVGDLVPA